MSILATSLRSFWAPGLNDVSGNTTKGVSSWLAEEQYQIYSPLKSKQFVVQVADTEPFLFALAADINRTSVAAYESIGQATKSKTFPRSTAWVLIQSYYAAFFAAHAALRMLGTGFINIGKAQAASLNKIGKLYGAWHADIEPGNFVFTFSGTKREIQWHRADSSSGGVHENFWSFFKRHIDGLSEDILKNKTTATADNQQVSTRLSELVDNLCYETCAKGNWLSVVRNRVNYKHEFGAWYPYKGQYPSATVEESLTRSWLADPMTINLSSHEDKNLRRFQQTCSFVIGCCRVLVSDMSSRCSTGKSFHTYGWLAISRFVQQKD